MPNGEVAWEGKTAAVPESAQDPVKLKSSGFPEALLPCVEFAFAALVPQALFPESRPPRMLPTVFPKALCKYIPGMPSGGLGGASAHQSCPMLPNWIGSMVTGEPGAKGGKVLSQVGCDGFHGA